MDAGLLSPRNNSVSGVGQAMDSDRIPNGFSSGFGAHLLQQKQQQQQQHHPHQLHQQHPLGSIGEVGDPTGRAAGGGGGVANETAYSL